MYQSKSVVKEHASNGDLLEDNRSQEESVTELNMAPTPILVTREAAASGRNLSKRSSEKR